MVSGSGSRSEDAVIASPLPDRGVGEGGFRFRGWGLFLVLALLVAGLGFTSGPAVAQGSVPAALVNFTGTDIYQGFIWLWKHPGDDSITHYEYNTSATVPGGTWNRIPNSNADTTLFEDRIGTAGGRNMRVRAVNANGPGPASPKISGNALSNRTVDLSVDSARVVEGNSGRRDITVTVSRSAGMATNFAVSPLIIQLNSSDSGNIDSSNNLYSSTATENTNKVAATSCSAPAPADADVCYPNGDSVSIPANQQSTTLTFSVLGDTTEEAATEIIHLRLKRPTTYTGFTLHNDVVAITIVDDDGANAPIAGSPEAPSSGSAVVGDRSVTLRWGTPSDPGTSPIVRYEYAYWDTTDKDGTVSSWLPIPGSNRGTTSYTVTGLMVGKLYGFEVRAINADGIAGEAISITGVDRIISVPAAPGNLKAKSGDSQVTLSWDQMGTDSNDFNEANGFAPVRRYEYSSRVGDGDWSPWTTMVAATGFTDFMDGSYNSYKEHTVTGLTNGTVYGFRVRAVNKNGTGAHSEVLGVVVSGVPGRPRGLTAVPSSGSVELSWQASSDGGSPITGWQYRYKGAAEGSTIEAFSDDDRWIAVPGSSASTTGYVVVGLANEWVYRFQVRAVNKNGAGTAATSADVNPGDVPGAPTALTGAPDKNSVTLSWTPPLEGGELNNGGSPIVRYEYSQKVGDGEWGDWEAIPVTAASEGTTGASVTATGEQSYKVSGLTAGTGYRFRVRAVNATGGGGYAETPNDYYPGQRPAAPISVTLTPSYDVRSGEGRITISWVAGSDGGSPVTKWQYKQAKTTTDLASSTDWKTICDAATMPGCASMTSVTVPRPPNAAGLPDGVSFFEDNRDYYIVVRALNGFHKTDDDVNTGGLPSAVAYARIEARVPRAPDGFIHWGYSADPKTSGAEASFHVYRDRLDNAVDSLDRVRDEYSFRTGDGPWSVWHHLDGDDEVGWKPFNDVPKKLGTEYTIRLRHVNERGAGAHKELRFVWGAPPLPGAANPDSSKEIPYLNAELGTSQVTLKLQYKPSSGGAFVDATTDADGTYRATVWEYSYRVGDGSWQEWATTNQNEQFAQNGRAASGYLVDGLDNGVAYSFRVRAVNDALGANPLYGQILESRRPVVPGVVPPAPLGLSAEGGDRRVMLSWISGGSGGPPITHWEYCEMTTRCDAKRDWQKVDGSDAGTTSATVTKFVGPGSSEPVALVNGTSYRFRVRAVNAIGGGAAAEALAVTPGRPPGAPVRVLVEAGDAQATLRVTKPAQPGLNLNRVVAYEARKKVAGGVYDAWETLGTTVAASSATTRMPSAESGAVVRNLVNGRTYTFQVRARNAYGPGAHVESSAVVPIGPPPPGTLSAAAGDTQVVLSWSSTGSGGSTITGWEYRQRQGDGGYGGWNEMADSTAATASHTVTGLSNGISYRFEVRAMTANSDVKGNAFASEPVVPSTVPPAPESVGAIRGDGEVALSWVAGTPGAPGEATWASATTSWQYRMRTDGDTEFGSWTTVADSDATTTGHVVEGLVNGISYTFEVRAVNAIGEGSAGSVSATPAKVPAAPTVTATAGDAMVTLSWASTGDGGSPITAWQMRTAGGEWVDVADSSATTMPVPNLTNGVAYTFEVRAINAVGSGAAGTASAMPAGAPPAPELTATAGDAMVTLSWASTGDGGSPITAWQVRTTGGEWVAMAADTTGMPVRNLTNGVAYTFEVRAVNAMGEGAVATESATPATVPSAPEVTATASDGEIVLSWASTDEGGSPITAWQYRTRIGVGDWGEWTTMAADASTTTLTGLDSGTGTVVYVFGVRAQNTVGDGAVTVSDAVTPTEESMVGDDYYSGVVTGPNFCARFSLGGTRLFALDSNGDGVADVCSLPYTRREAIARQNAVVTLANRYPDQYRALVNAACAEVEGDEPCGGDALAAPGYPPIDDGGPYYSGTITGPSYCANRSLGGPTTYPLDSNGDGVADVCSLPYSRREAIARQMAGDTLAAMYLQRFNSELAEECRRLAASNYGDNSADLANDVCTTRT